MWKPKISEGGIKKKKETNRRFEGWNENEGCKK